VSQIEEIESLIKKAQYFQAHNLCIDLMNHDYQSLKLEQLYALTLARLGATDKAFSFLEPIYRRNNRDAETSGLMGRIYKDLWKKNREPKYAKLSRDIYLDNFREDNKYYTGINAATMSLLIGETNLAIELANKIIQNLDKVANDYWSLATLGEAYLITGLVQSSVSNYKKAFLLAANNYGDINSSYQQLLLILSAMKLDIPSELLELLKPPQIIVFSGHMIDRFDRKTPRFPYYIENEVRDRVKAELEELDAKIGYTSVACGSDIIFIEEMLNRNAEVNVFLPFQKEDFLITSVSFAGEDWVKRFEKCLANSNVKFITEEPYLGDDHLFSFTGNLLIGLGILRARMLATIPTFLGVLDMSDIATRLKAGSSEMLHLWPFKSTERIIDISSIPKKDSLPLKSFEVSNTNTSFGKAPYQMQRVIKCILFADIVGFSKMNEEQTPYFMYELLSMISENIHRLEKQPEVINTWGDAIFAVYDSALDMINFATVVNQIILNTDWLLKKLPENTSIRIALHTGPIYLGIDPITRKPNAYGSHINRTARMEPVTLPGYIYASEQFAATLIVETGEEYDYNYVGIIELPKNFGKQEIYSIGRK
jgi:hypothetical protein